MSRNTVRPVVFLVGLLFCAVLAQANPLNRDRDPVVMTGAALSSLAGQAVDQIVAFRYQNAWQQIPVQLDERKWVDFGTVYHQAAIGYGTFAYADATTYAGADNDPTFDHNDELVVMARDAGSQAPGSAGLPAGVLSPGVEIEITDPLSGGKAYVYLFSSSGSLDPAAGQNLVTYSFVLSGGKTYIPDYNLVDGPNAEESEVISPYYYTRFIDRWICNELHVYAGGATGVDILDRHKNLFAPDNCSRSELTFCNAEGAFFTNKDGPVRAIRSYMGANSGPYTQREHIFYEQRQDSTTFLRVHAIGGIMDLYDYSPAATGMAYYNNLNTGGVIVDGVPDTITAGPIAWEMVTGAQGSVIVAEMIDTDVLPFAHTSYYSDDSTPSVTQCTGDAYEYATSGIWINQSIPNTDPARGAYNLLSSRRVIYYEAPGQTAANATTRSNWARNPLTFTTQGYPHPDWIPPSITQHPAGQIVTPGGSTSFAIVATGASPLNYQWQKDNSNLTNGGHYSGCTTSTLVLTNCDAADVAGYRCVVTNPYGTATSNAAFLTLDAEGGPTITQQPVARSLCAASSTTFAVAAAGQGTLTYQWQKDSVNLSNGGHYSGVTTATLAVTGADSNDVAYYRCVVTDSTGSTYTSQASLTLKTATAVTLQPVSQSVFPGSTAHFEVSAVGDGTLSYQWQVNGTALTNGGHFAGVTTATLTVSNCDVADAGNYRCIATGSCGAATSNEAVLNVLACTLFSLQNGSFDDSVGSWAVAPNWTSYSSGAATFSKDTTVFVSSPNAQRIIPPASGSGAYAGVRQTVNANVGDAVTFVAYAYQNSASSYETARLGARFDGSTSLPTTWQSVASKQSWTKLVASGVVTVANGATVFLDVLRGTAGTYFSSFDDVSAFYAYMPPAPVVGNPTSSSLSVDVNPGCNLSNGDAEYAISVGGGAYTLGTHWVQVNGNVGTSVIWQPDATWGTKAVTGLAAGTTYTFKVKARYSGVYTQETSLGAGTLGTTGGGTVPPPTITQQPAGWNGCAGLTVQFIVAATGQGTLTYQWQKNQTNLSNGGHYSGCTATTLTIAGTDSGDVASYRCIVTNAGGSTTSNSAALTLKSSTTITGQPSDQSILVGGSAGFSVTAIGEGSMAYQWQKNSVNITDGGHYSGCATATLTVSSADGTDSASYRCVVTAGCGSANSNEATLTVGTPAVPGDFDHDGDVDQADFAVLQNCFTEEGSSPAIGCSVADFDKNSTVDQSDRFVFEGCLSGPDIPGDPNCAD